MSSSTIQTSEVENELRVRLYLHHTPSGPNKNQITVVEPNGPGSFGSVVIHDWPLTGTLDPNGKVFARAQGMHVQAGIVKSNWYNTFSLVFEDDRFKGSAFEVKGTDVNEGEWSIVGGSGQFAKAEGVIYKKKVHDQNGGDIMEVTIIATYTRLDKPT
ncbi:hypothetical protein LUZ61_012745 [Rhynchospora tenuis]|uniref:Dirigent protein n=1 Tax=Rhynchospora tenuis TaxID=198213 RepID=A0AAD6A3N2_9POAL|nr:hypothetical protein LUZ61_012745 [Rhynchospora tenuis]